MLYLAIPAHNEVATIGVLLWRIRTVLAEFPREYEVVVYDDASSDETAEVAEQYAHAMPVTVLRGATHVGYAGALDALIRHVSAQTRYPRRDAMLLVQGDFTDPPGIVPEFARRFEGGADLVVGERMVVADAPIPVRRLFKAAHWVMRPFVRVDGVNDLTASMRLIRISALRDLVRQAGSDPICVGDSWTANADLLLKLAITYRIDIATLADDGQEELNARLQSVLREPFFADIDLPALDIADIAASYPAFGEALLRLQASAEAGAVELRRAQPHHVRGWVAQLRTRGLGPRSIAIHLAAWRGLYRWLGRDGLVALNPVDVSEIGALKAQVEKNPDDFQARLDLAILLNGADEREAATDQLLYIIRKMRAWNDEAARKQLLTVFEAAGLMSEIARQGRKRLSAILFS